MMRKQIPLWGLMMLLVGALAGSCTPEVVDQSTGYLRFLGSGVGDEVIDMLELPDGGFVMVGQVDSLNGAGPKLWLARTSALGFEEWSIHYRPATGIEVEPRSLTRLGDGRLVVLVTEITSADGSRASRVYEFDETGTFLSDFEVTATLGSLDARGITASADQNLVIIATVTDDTGNEETVMTKVNEQGGVIWRTTFPLNQAQLNITPSDALIETDLGNWIWTETFTSGPQSSRLRVASATETGGTRWTYISSDTVRLVTADVKVRENDLAVLGQIQDGNQSDIFLLLLNRLGTQIGDYIIREENGTLNGLAIQWNRDEVPTSLAVVPGGFVIAGSTESFGEGESDILLVRTDAQGNVVWKQTFGSDEDDYAAKVIATSDGGYAVAGTFSFGNNPLVCLIKVDAMGNINPAAN